MVKDIKLVGSMVETIFGRIISIGTVSTVENITLFENSVDEDGNVKVALQSDGSGLATEATLLTVSTNTGYLEGVLDMVQVANASVGTGSFTWSALDAANTLKTKTDLTTPTNLRRIYDVMIENPSQDTDITGQLYQKQTFNSVVRWVKLGETFTVTKSPDETNPDQVNKVSGVVVKVQGAYLGEGLGIALWNNDIATNEFTARLVVREAD